MLCLDVISDNVILKL